MLFNSFLLLLLLTIIIIIIIIISVSFHVFLSAFPFG